MVLSSLDLGLGSQWRGTSLVLLLRRFLICEETQTGRPTIATVSRVRGSPEKPCIARFSASNPMTS